MYEADFWFDESGDFHHPSTFIPRSDSPNSPIISQIVGILTPKSALSSQSAAEILRAGFVRADIPMPAEVHGAELRRDNRFQVLLQSLTTDIHRRNWQPVRLENRDRVGFGDRWATYTRLVAELILRVFEGLRREGHGEIRLHVTGALVKTGDHPDGGPELLEDVEYRDRIEERLAFAAFRRGVSPERLGWRLAGFRLRSARTWPALQLCDLLSNASFQDFRKCDAETRRVLSDAFENWAFSLTLSDAARSARRQIDRGDVASAVKTLAEADRESALLPSVRERLDELRRNAVAELDRMEADARNIQLRQIEAWLWQMVQFRRNPAMAREMVDWVRKFVWTPLQSAGDGIGKDLEWFAWGLHVTALSAANHRGDLFAAGEEIEAMDRLLPLLAGRWEHAPALLGGLVNQAVHLTDAFRFGEVARRMKAVVAYYENLSALLCDAFPGFFPDRVRSFHRALALGTWLQAEAFGGLRDLDRLETARRLNDEAIAEFSADSDRARQYQYRSMIETFAGDLDAARSYLARSLGGEGQAADAIPEMIACLPDPARGFPLLHWTRIGAEAARRNRRSEIEAAFRALRRTRLLFDPWATEPDRPYPAHGIRRNIAVIAAGAGETDTARSMLGHLEAIAPNVADAPVLALVAVAARCEVAAVVGRRNVESGRVILRKGEGIGACESIRGKLEYFPELARIVEEIGATAREWSNAEKPDPSRLIRTARLVGY